jgi:hypothetical protein
VLRTSDDKTRSLGTVTSCIVVTSYLRGEGSFIRRAFINGLFVVTLRVSVGSDVETSGKEKRWFSECLKTVVSACLGKKCLCAKHMKQDGKLWTVVVCVDVGTLAGFCEHSRSSIGFHKIREMSRIAEKLLASQERLYIIELVTYKEQNPSSKESYWFCVCSIMPVMQLRIT